MLRIRLRAGFWLEHFLPQLYVLIYKDFDVVILNLGLKAT
jgi:hypothetical protein